jgi:hypothetical protein
MAERRFDCTDGANWRVIAGSGFSTKSIEIIGFALDGWFSPGNTVPQRTAKVGAEISPPYWIKLSLLDPSDGL